MLQEERYEKILNLLSERKHLTVEEVRDVLEISFSTVRRDFRTLVERKLVLRSRGGISLIGNTSDDGNTPFELRQVTCVNEKETLARHAVSMLKPHDTFFLDGGTTTLQMTKMLPNFPLTIVTNSMPHVSSIIQHQPSTTQYEIYTAGGYVYVPWHVNLGPQARYCLSQYHANMAFLSCKGIDELGTYNHNEMVVEIERTMIQNADNVVFLIDNSKLGKRSISFLCELNQINTLITTNIQNTTNLLTHCKQANVNVVSLD
jgi:DeoR/GlpR family transcriptional regulator of sugar metabolism